MLIGRFDARVVRWCGSVIQFGRTRVAKRHSPSKNQEFGIVAKTVLNIDEALLLENFRLECLYNFRYFATMTLLKQSTCFFCGLGVSKWIISLGLCGFAVGRDLFRPHERTHVFRHADLQRSSLCCAFPIHSSMHDLKTVYLS